MFVCRRRKKSFFFPFVVIALWTVDALGLFLCFHAHLVKRSPSHRNSTFAQVFELTRYPKITSLRTQSAAARKIESSEL